MLLINAAIVQALMLKLGIGVMELAELARIPPKTISALHRRDTKVFLPTLSRLAKALKTSPEQLIKEAI